MELDLSSPMTPSVSGHNPFKKSSPRKNMASESASMDDHFFASLMSLDKGKTIEETKTKLKAGKPKMQLISKFKRILK